MREFTLPGVATVCLLFDDGVVCGVLVKLCRRKCEYSSKKVKNAVNADIILKSIDENELNYIQRFLT